MRSSHLAKAIQVLASSRLLLAFAGYGWCKHTWTTGYAKITVHVELTHTWGIAGMPLVPSCK
jgi:hypothetical protein